MSFEMHSERQVYAKMLDHEVKQVVRMLRAFPVEQFELRHRKCAHSARELAAESVAHVRGIEEIVYGRVTARAVAVPFTRRPHARVGNRGVGRLCSPHDVACWTLERVARDTHRLGELGSGAASSCGWRCARWCAMTGTSRST